MLNNPQFAWLESQLLEAAAERESIILVTHIPPAENGYDSLEMWRDGYTVHFYQLLWKYRRFLAVWREFRLWL